jgi:hypothetical protein
MFCNCLAVEQSVCLCGLTKRNERYGYASDILWCRSETLTLGFNKCSISQSRQFKCLRDCLKWHISLFCSEVQLWFLAHHNKLQGELGQPHIMNGCWYRYMIRTLTATMGISKCHHNFTSYICRYSKLDLCKHTTKYQKIQKKKVATSLGWIRVENTRISRQIFPGSSHIYYLYLHSTGRKSCE